MTPEQREYLELFDSTVSDIESAGELLANAKRKVESLPPADARGQLIGRLEVLLRAVVSEAGEAREAYTEGAAMYGGSTDES